jgi:hypothetical protein
MMVAGYKERRHAPPYLFVRLLIKATIPSIWTRRHAANEIVE